MLLQDYLARAAENRPEAVALAMGDEQLTYAQVATSSDKLASMLADRGLQPGDRVGLLLPKRPSAVVAMHAVLKAGAVYVPLDTESPPPRLARIVASAEPRLLLAVPEAAERLDALAEVLPLPPVGSVEPAPVVDVAGHQISVFAGRDWENLSASSPTVRAQNDAAAHILFTSGSTGEPKGVVITHRNVAAFVDWAISEFGTRPTDRISGHPPLHFDLSTFDIYGTFAAGAELHLVPPTLSVNPRALASFIRDRELTQWFSVPSLLTYMARFDVVAHGDFPALERLLWCGEVLPTPVLCHWMRRLPHVRFTNLYGPTEATIASSHYTLPAVPDETQPVPIGTACDEEELLVLDEALRPTPVNEIGDLYIGGAGLSPGYWRDEDKTSAAFVPDPRTPGSDARIYRTGDLARIDEHNVIHFLGRADSQIKSRGYRIELGEIESALNAVDGVKECAVVGVDTGGFEGTAICAAYVAGNGVEPPQLRSQLATSLPAYMLPVRWMSFDVLPKNQNGKIDRSALRERFVTEQATRDSG